MSIDPVAIARTGLDVEWQRMQVIAQNLANENTTRVVGGGGYRPLRLRSGPATAFSQIVAAGTVVAEPTGTQVLGVAVDPVGYRAVHDPRHPDADRAGNVYYPAIDHAEQMALLVKTARAYEANLTVLSLAQQMTMRALDLGKA
jgi:flagellar basal-body rod protein FlgC